MKLSGLLPRQQLSLSGVVGTARAERRQGGLPHRLNAGDIAILDHADLDRRTAMALVDAQVVGVINAAPSISGRFPNLGPEILVSAGIVLIDGVGGQFLRQVKNGTKLRLDRGRIFAGRREIGKGAEQDADSVADRLIEAKAGMSAQLEAFSANTIEFLRRERMLVIDGLGVPELTVSMKDRHVLVLAPGYTHADDLRRLRWYVREYHPVLVAVDSGADTLCRAGYTPSVIVGDPDSIDRRTLTCGAEVVIPAHLDGHAPGLERVQDLGVAAVTFPATGNPEDLALLLADAQDASLVITVGFQATLHEFLDRGRSGSNPSTFLTRLKLGNRLVDGAAVAALRRGPTPAGAIVFLIVAVLMLVCVALLVSGLGDAYIEVFAELGKVAETYLRGLFT